MQRLQEFFATEVGYVVLLFSLFVLPRILQRFRLPSAITALGMGAIAGMGFGLYAEDRTVHLFATLGIVALFLFAGLEVDFRELRDGAGLLTQHLVVRIVVLLCGVAAVIWFLPLRVRPAVIVALALLTPSTGFILDSLGAFGLTAQERFWVKAKAIATELLALVILFVVLQSSSTERLVLASAALAAMIAVLPLLFRLFARVVVPYAPNSEFAFLLMLAVLFAFATRELGVYYLVGAFLVGTAAQRFRQQSPAMASERLIHAVEMFASFFIPFYFFSVGTGLRRADFSLAALGLGAAFLAVALPVRILTVTAHRQLVVGEPFRHALRVAVPLVPTLVFTLVLAGILRDQFRIPEGVYGGLIVYTLVNTLLPGFAFGTPAPALDTPDFATELALVDVRPPVDAGGAVAEANDRVGP